MATFEIFMPALSSTMTEGKIVEWLKQPGDRVERGESVLVVESDKADMDVESFEAGFLGAVLLPAGGTAPVGETIGLVVETEAELAELKANGPATPAALRLQPHRAPAPAAAPHRPLSRLRHLPPRLLPWLRRPLLPVAMAMAVAWWPAPAPRNWPSNWACNLKAYAAAAPMAA